MCKVFDHLICQPSRRKMWPSHLQILVVEEIGLCHSARNLWVCHSDSLLWFSSLVVQSWHFYQVGLLRRLLKHCLLHLLRWVSHGVLEKYSFLRNHYDVIEIIQMSLRIHASHFFLSSDLSYTLHNWSNIDISYLNTLITLNFKLITNNFWWPLNSQRLLRTALRTSCRWSTIQHGWSIFFEASSSLNKSSPSAPTFSAPFLFMT